MEKTKISWRKEWGDPKSKFLAPYQYELTGPWFQYQSKDSLAKGVQFSGGEGDRLYRELARSLLVGHAAIVVISINTVANILGSAWLSQMANPKIIFVAPLITFVGALGIYFSGFGLLRIARHAQAVQAGLEAFKRWVFPELAAITPDDDALRGFEQAHTDFRISWMQIRESYRCFLHLSLALFILAIVLAVYFMVSIICNL